MAFKSAAHTVEQERIAQGVNQGTAGVNLNTGDALHDGVGPAHLALRRYGKNGLLHGVEHCGELEPAAFNLSEAGRGVRRSDSVRLPWR